MNPQLQAYKGLLKQLQTAQNPQLALQQALTQNAGLKQALDIARLGNGNMRDHQYRRRGMGNYANYNYDDDEDEEHYGYHEYRHLPPMYERRY